MFPDWPKSKVLELAPVNWRVTLERPVVQRALGDNVFRRVSLGGLEAIPARR